MMQAVTYDTYGTPDVLQIKTVNQPTPQADELLVRVHATGLNKADVFLLSGKPWFLRLQSGLFRPSNQIPGSDVVGIVEAVGESVARFKVGDAVIADLSEAGRAGLAEWVTIPETFATEKPPSLSFEEAAGLPMAGMTAYQALHKGEIAAGETVLIHGASGGVGSFAVQIASACGAEVTAVCSTGKIEQAKDLGATHTVDYKKKDFAKQERRYDLVLAINGDRKMSDYQRVLNHTGRVVVAGGSMTQIFSGMLLGRFVATKGQSISSFLSVPSHQDLSAVAELAESGKIRPIIEKVFPFEHAAEGFRHLYSGKAAGKVVITNTA